MAKTPKPLAATPMNIRRVLKAAGFTESKRTYKNRRRSNWDDSPGFRIEPFKDWATKKEYLGVAHFGRYEDMAAQCELYRAALRERFRVEVVEFTGDYGLSVSLWAVLPLDTVPTEESRP